MSSFREALLTTPRRSVGTSRDGIRARDMAGGTPSTSNDQEPWVATVDNPTGLPLTEARLMCKRFWYLGWFGLPLAWATNAYYFWPHVKGEVWGGTDTDEGPQGTSENPPPIVDPVIKKYATQSLRGAQAAFVVVVAWAITFWAGGKTLFGEEMWAYLSVTAQPPAE